MGFDGNGNITQKSDLGAFTLKYGGEKEDGTGTSSTTKSGVASGAGIGGGIAGGIGYLFKPPVLPMAHMDPPMDNDATAYQGEIFGNDKDGNLIIANLNNAEVIGHYVHYIVPIVEANPGLNNFPIEFAALLAVFAPEAIAVESGAVETTSESSSEVGLQFGKTENQIYHTFRHTDAMGLDRDMIKDAIESDMKTASSEAIEGQLLNRILEISGQRIQYTGYKLPEGIFNIGRIHGIE